MNGPFSIFKSFLNSGKLDIPRLPIDEALDDPNRDEDTANPDVRRPMRLLDSLVQRDDELSDSEDEGEGGRKNHARHRDSDSIVSPSGRRFGVGVGIMGAAPLGAGTAAAAAAGGVAHSASAAGSGGPSAHTAVEKLVKKTGDEPIDVDISDAADSVASSGSAPAQKPEQDDDDDDAMSVSPEPASVPAPPTSEPSGEDVEPEEAPNVCHNQ